MTFTLSGVGTRKEKNDKNPWMDHLLQSFLWVKVM